MIFKYTQTATTSFTHSEFTFQSGDIQIHTNFVILLVREKYLHSNLVIFKFLLIPIFILTDNRFTFQSGDIQISLASPPFITFSIFTFQSGDIQINFAHEILRLQLQDLHSNLVIFKSDKLLSYSIELYEFTFQSGDIQILLIIVIIIYINIDLHSNLVIFKCAKLTGQNGIRKIYIPIW